MSLLISSLFIILLGWAIAGPLVLPAGWRMARSLGHSSWLALLLLVPGLGLVLFVAALQPRFAFRGGPSGSGAVLE